MTEESRSNRSSRDPTPPQEFQFINVSDGQRANPQTLRLVHSHAQANYMRRNRRQRKQTTWDVDVSRLMDNSGESSGQSRNRPGPAPQTMLSASRSDPFASFGFEAGSRAHRLWDHVYDGTCAKFRALIEIGFLDLVRETIAISQILSASSWHLVHWCCVEEDRGEDARYSLITTQSLQQRLNNLTSGTSDEVITTVLASAAYANLIKETQLFLIHMEGLGQILLHRGGENTLNSCAPLRLAMFWIELNGRLRQDTAPQYPPPYHILMPISRLNLDETRANAQLADRIFDETDETTSIQRLCQQLRRLNEVIAEESIARNLWQDAVFPVFNIAPIQHDCLSMPRASLYDDIQARQRECFRLATLLYLMELRAKVDYEAGQGMLYGTKLQLMLGTQGILPTWEGSNDLLLWVLTVGACSAILFDDLRGQFVALLSESLRAANIRTFEEYATRIIQLTWSEVAFGPALRGLEGQIDFHRG